MDQKPRENAFGRIAETYDELHGLHHLRKARAWAAVQPSRETALRTVYQAAEVALLNLSDLTRRAARDIDGNNLSKASIKLTWVIEFNRLLASLARIPDRFPIANCSIGVKQSGGFRGSPALAQHLRSMRDFDAAVAAWIGRRNTTYESLIMEEPTPGTAGFVVHQAKLAAHTTEIWEKLFLLHVLPSAAAPYSSWACSADLEAMVHDFELTTESYLLQFRGLHQIPEILAAEANAQLAVATEFITAGGYCQAYEPFESAVALTDGIVASLVPLIECMTTGDYHFIRENLGPTSGTYSRALNDALLGRQNENLSAALAEQVHRAGEQSMQVSDRDLQSLIRLAWIHRSQLSQWRDYHLALPRHNLGTGKTKSMIGNLDGVKTVEALRDAAEIRDQKDPLWKSLNLPAKTEGGRLGSYFESADSLYDQLLAATGIVTRKRFPGVQAQNGPVPAPICPFNHSTIGARKPS